VGRVTTVVDFACDPARRAGRTRCALLAWAASGGMALTGWPDVAPRPPPPALWRRLERLVAGLADTTSRVGERVEVDLASTLFGRAARLGGRRAGRTSVGGSCQLLATADGWVAVNLPRVADVELVPALVGSSVADPWAALTAYAAAQPAGNMAARAQELGLPVAELGAAGARVAPCRVHRLGGRRRGGARPLVVDLSAMWAGPLAAQLLGRAGARVVKVETATRPDGARRGPASLFDALHGGHESVTVDVATSEGRAQLAALLERADVVIEASRPRALRQLGFDAERMVRARPGLTWLAITAYGRSSAWSNRVGFGDDAAVAGGLVARDDAGDPVFCGDAIADPIAGLFGALGAASSLERGGGVLVDVSLAGAAAWAAEPVAVPVRRHRVTEVGQDRWVVQHGARHVGVAPPRAAAAPVAAEAAGASTARVLAELGAAGCATRRRPPVPGRPSSTRRVRPPG